MSRALARIAVLAAAAALAAAPAPSAAQTAGQAAEPGGQADLLFWQSVTDSNDPAQYEAYLAAFPQGLFARLARAKINAATPVPPPTATAAAALPIPVPVPATVPAPQAPRPAVPAATTTAAAPDLDPAFAESLRALAMTQGDRYRGVIVVLPNRPVATPLEPLRLPPQFCSAAERNAFHDTRFLPLIDRASANNSAAIGHMELLGRLVEEASNQGDSDRASALGAEARRFEPVAVALYQERAALDEVFTRIMATPVANCGGTTP